LCPLYKAFHIFLVLRPIKISFTFNIHQYWNIVASSGSWISMASLVLLFSELVRNHEWDAAALLAAYPPPNFTITSSSCAAAAKTTWKDEGFVQKKSKDTVVENPMESRVCVDLVWPWILGGFSLTSRVHCKCNPVFFFFLLLLLETNLLWCKVFLVFSLVTLKVSVFDFYYLCVVYRESL